LGGKVTGAIGMTGRATEGAGRQADCPSPVTGRPAVLPPFNRSRRAVAETTEPSDKIARPSGAGSLQAARA